MLTTKEKVDGVYHGALDLMHAGKGGQAQVVLKEALQALPPCDPMAAKCWHAMGQIYFATEQDDVAFSCFQHALAIAPDNPQYRYDFSITLLRQGNPDGWTDWAARPANTTRGFIPADFQAILAGRGIIMPRWTGEPLNGKRLLVISEQGFGDILQFSRYFERIDGAVTFICRPPLRRLCEHSFAIPCPSNNEITVDDMRGFDAWCSIADLPAIYRGDPGTVPYITPKSEWVDTWRERLGELPGLRVGLVWAGSPSQDMDYARSLHLSDFAPLGEVAGEITFVSLQVGPSAGEAFTSPRGITIVVPEIGDFADTSAIIANLDLVITVDTSVAHLAGAMGVPVWNLLYFSPDWRWQLKREDTPWYPSMRLFRQGKDLDWRNVMAQVAAASGERVIESQAPRASGAES